MLKKNSFIRRDQFTQLFERIRKDLSGSNTAEVGRWMRQNKVETALELLKKELKIRTILSSKDRVHLFDFYFHSPVLLEDKELNYHSLVNFISKGKLPIIIGTVGQGKSVYLRYLFAQELHNNNAIPLFIQLRDIKKEISLFENLKNNFEKISLPISQTLLNQLLISGYVSIFLDGFDEVDFDYRSELLDEIENFVSKYPSSKIIMTSRPDTEILSSAISKQFQLRKLMNLKVRVSFIKQCLKSASEKDALIKKIEDIPESISELLTTPLMLSLFITVYSNNRTLPSSHVEFFDAVFSHIWIKHDGLKCSLARPSKTGFGENSIQSAIEHISFKSRKDNLRSLTENQVLSYLDRFLIEIDRRDVDSRKLLYDIKDNTCLIVKEGVEYHFLHDSIQEFYSAKYVKNAEKKKSFYDKYINDWKKWDPEIEILSYIDKYSFYKFFELPSLNKILSFENGEISISNSQCKTLLSSLLVVILEPKNKSEKKGVFVIYFHNKNRLLDNTKALIGYKLTKNGFEGELIHRMQKFFTNLIVGLKSHKSKDLSEIRPLMSSDEDQDQGKISYYAGDVLSNGLDVFSDSCSVIRSVDWNPVKKRIIQMNKFIQSEDSKGEDF